MVSFAMKKIQDNLDNARFLSHVRHFKS